MGIGISQILDWIIKSLGLFFNLIFTKTTWNPPDMGSIFIIMLTLIVGFIPIFLILRKIIFRNENEHSTIKLAFMSILILVILGFVSHFLDKNPIILNNQPNPMPTYTNTSPVSQNAPQYPIINLNQGG